MRADGFRVSGFGLRGVRILHFRIYRRTKVDLGIYFTLFSYRVDCRGASYSPLWTVIIIGFFRGGGFKGGVCNPRFPTTPYYSPRLLKLP